MLRDTKPIDYPSPDGTLSFDILTSVARTGTNHAENQPVHLVVSDRDYARHTETNVGEYAGLLNKACPAGVYEYVDVAESGGEEHAQGKRFVINSQNCIHVRLDPPRRGDAWADDDEEQCKTCSIKVPTQDITWEVPEGGGGPAYCPSFLSRRFVSTLTTTSQR